MKLVFTAKAFKDYENLSLKLQALVDKQLESLLLNIQYPSLKAKKYDESQDIWSLRLNRNYRLFFRIIDDTYLIITISKHPK
jgi:mRNA-degrading endonuclease RelE of RelBE toxin-antitoxin system